MRNFTITAFAFVLLAGPALAGEEVMTGYFGNTVVSTGQFEAHTHYRTDHTFDVTFSAMGMSRSFKGSWAFDAGGQFCRIYVGDLLPGAQATACRTLAAHKVGDSWTLTTDGDTRSFTLKAGIQ